MFGFFVSVFLQIPTFAKAYGGTGADYTYSIARTSEGGFALAGETHSGGAGGADVLLIRLDSVGNIIWAKAYGGAGDDFAYSIAETYDRGFVIAGETKSYGAGGSDILILRTDSMGTLLWARTYGGSLDDYAQSVVQTQDSGFGLVGVSRSYGSGNGDCILLRLTSSGALSWGRTYGGTNFDLASDLVVVPDGGFLVAGYSFSFSATDKADFMVIRTNSSGGLSWAKVFGGPSSDYARGIAASSDGNYIIVGSTYSFGFGEYDFMILKIGPAGNLIWAKTFGDLDMEYAHDAVPTFQGGCVVIGQTQDYGAGLHDFMLLNIGPAGDLLWAKTFGGTNGDYPRCIAQTADGGYAVAGYSYSFGAGSYDALVLRVDTDGNYKDCTQDCVPQVSSPSPMTSTVSVGVICNPGTTSPSPVSSSLSLTTTVACEPFGTEEGLPARRSAPICYPVSGGVGFIAPRSMPLRVFSVDGKLVRSAALKEGDNLIRLDPGVYFWEAGEIFGKAVVR